MNRQHTDSLHRTVALNLVTIALEIGGESLCTFISWAVSKDEKKTKKSFSRKTSLVDMHLENTKDSHTTISVSETLATHIVDVAPHADSSSERNEPDFQTLVDSGAPVITESVRLSTTERVRLGLIAKELLTDDICKHIFQVPHKLTHF